MAKVVGTPGVISDKTSTRQSLPLLAPNAPFFLAWHPESWTITADRVVPRTCRIRQEPGINGCDADGGMAIAYASYEARGWKRIPFEKGPNGQSYLASVEVAGGRHWLTAWDSAYGGSSARTHDTRGWVEWLVSLMADGTISPPPEYRIAEMIRTIEVRVSDYADKAQTIPSYKAKLKAAQAELKAAQAMLKEHETALAGATPVKAKPETPNL